MVLTPDCCTNKKKKPGPTNTSILKKSFAQYSAKDLLEHFTNRRTVNFFPVCEANQVSSSFIDDVLQNRFRFNHEIHSLGSTVHWLDNPSNDSEWLIMLHKGYYLVGLMKLFYETGEEKYLNKWIELTDSWVKQVNDPGFIATDVTGRRIQNWVYAFYYLVRGKPHHTDTEGFLLRFLTSLQNQVNFLINNLAKARNHRTLELYAIFLAAVVFPEFSKAESWLDFSVQALANNAATDILADGVHCELSTFYHHIVLKNLLAVKRLATANQITMPLRFDAAVCRALQFSLFIHKPDGQIPALSDGDTGSFYHLLKQGYDFYGEQPIQYVLSQGKKGLPPDQNAIAFSESGYYILRSPWYSEAEPYQDARYLVFDCGPLGAGNHGHLDLLNIEVAAYGRSLVVDPGRYSYDESGQTNWRILFRSTRYHNTVEVDGKNQIKYRYSKSKGKFHILGKHTVAVMSCFLSGNNCHLLHGSARSHEYTALHHRKIFFVNGEYWLISDILQDLEQHQYALRFHLSPEAQNLTCIEQNAHAITIDSPNLVLMQPACQQRNAMIEQGFISYTYGEKIKAPSICFEQKADNTLFESVLFPYKQQKPKLKLQTLDAEISGDQKAAWTRSAFSLHIQSETQSARDLFFIAYDGHPGLWRFNNIDCAGQFCYIRLNKLGIVENFFSGPNSTIKVEGQMLSMQESRP